MAGEPNVSYICSRYYRAPELIFGATNYTTDIDIWSAGCVMAELMQCQPMFPGESGIDQLVEIIRVLGTPTKEQLLSMNPNYTEHRFPQIKPTPFSKIFRSRSQSEAVEFLTQMLQYAPLKRLSAIDAMAHPFFDELRHPDTRLATGKQLPPLFDFSEHGTSLFCFLIDAASLCVHLCICCVYLSLYPIELSIKPELNGKLVPPHAEEELLSRGIDIHNFRPMSAAELKSKSPR